jgi:hypothetical protein
VQRGTSLCLYNNQLNPNAGYQKRAQHPREFLLGFVEVALILVVEEVVVEEWVDTEGMLEAGIGVVDMVVAVRILV